VRPFQRKNTPIVTNFRRLARGDQLVKNFRQSVACEFDLDQRERKATQGIASWHVVAKWSHK